MSKILVVALVLVLCPLCAASAEQSKEVVLPEAQAPSVEATPVQPAASPDLGLMPEPVFLSACTDLCYSEWNSCRVDCHFQPYPGCIQDCNQERDACIAAC